MRRHITFVSLAALAAAACSPDSGEAADADGPSGDAAVVSRESSDAPVRTIAELERQSSRSESAPQALEALHLSQSGDGRVTFGEVENDGAVTVFNDVSFIGEDGETIAADSIRLVGAALAGDEPSFDALVISNLTINGDEDSATLGRFELTEPNAAVVALVARALEGDDDIDMDLGKLSDYAFGRLAVEGLSFNGDDGGEGSFGSLRFENFHDGRLGAFAFENLAIDGTSEDGEEVHIALGSWTMNGLNLAGLDALAELGDDPDPEDLQRALNVGGLSDPFQRHYDDYALRDVFVNVDGVKLTLDSLAGRAQETRGGLLSTDEMSPLVIEFDEAGSLGAQAKAGLAMLGYDRLEITSSSETMADYLNDRLYSNNSVLTVKDAFSLAFNYDVGGVQEYMKNAEKNGLASSFDFDPDAMANLLRPLTLNSFEIRLTDDSIVERSLEAAAAMNGGTADEVRNQAVAMMTIGSMMAPQGPAQDVVRDAITAATSFLSDPGVLTISIDADEPVSLADVFAALDGDDPTAALELINIDFEATRR